ncbi:phosphatidylserine decarboxylase [Acetobacteraceae bacterium]|nr:phosphatidylserine decarboxylase [Acetobacteraceae bacterium]
MSFLRPIKESLAAPHRAGLPFIAIGFITAIAGRRFDNFFGRLLCRLGLLFAGFCLYFFRHPKRVLPPHPLEEQGTDRYVIAAADGRIQSVELVVPPKELDMGDQPVWRVATFLSVLNVHVNRIPVTGTITKTDYREGKFFNASLDKASEFNERNSIRITTEYGQKDIGVVQIAGLIARRIICEAEIGDKYEVGETYGLIRFGSRTDIYLPPGVKPLVHVGQLALGGETLIALL